MLPSRRRYCASVAASVLLACAPAWAQLGLDLTDTGCLTDLTLAGKPVASLVELKIPKPDWHGSHADLATGRATGRRVEGNRETVIGVAPATGEASVSYRVEVTREADSARLAYSVTPTRDLQTAALVLCLHLPLTQYAGKRWLINRDNTSATGTFPEELPEPYAFIRESGFEWFGFEVEGGTYLAVAPEWSGFAHLQVQDNRKFGGQEFEVQLYAKTPKTLKAGESYSFALSMRTVDPAALKAKLEEQQRRQQALASTLTGSGPARIERVQPNTTELPTYGKFELAVDLQAEFTNPFDPEEIALEGHFVRPDGKELVVPGFLYWGYERQRVQGAEKLLATGDAGWRVRFCPTVPGRYRYWLTLRDGATETRTREATFTAAASKHPGLVRVAKGNPLYLEFDSGDLYYAIGANVCWPGPGGTFDYDHYWQKLADNGANYARLWIGPFDCFTLERSSRGDDDPFGLGRYDLANSWRVDYVLDEAAKRGIEVMFCIDSFNSLRNRPSYPRWKECPYNAANGGPCQTPEEFFTHPEALKLFRQRLRYIVARWSYQPAVLSWEFWNEVNIIEKYVSETSVPWHRDMARYLRALDPYDHLITTSWAGVTGDPKVDALPELDYLQSHQYGAHDPAQFMAEVCYDKAQRFGKPHYFGEYGTGTRAEGTQEDTEGLHLHNGLWSGVVSQACGTGMLWWWNNYIEPRNLYHHFRPVAAFVSGVPFNKRAFPRARVENLAFVTPPATPRRDTLDLHPERGSWQPAPFNQPTTFVVSPTGRVTPEDRLTRVLHGTRNHPTLHNPATFQVDYARDGTFVVVVSGVSGYGGARLKVSLDGETKLDKDFVDDDESNDTLTKYNGDHAIAVPAGKHTVQVTNEGNDWLYVGYRLPDYCVRTAPPVQVFALQSTSAAVGEVAAIAWIKNARCNWFNAGRGETLEPVAATRFELVDLSAGTYEVEWWDTYRGEPTKRETVSARDGRLRLVVPAFLRDLACKVRRRG